MHLAEPLCVDDFRFEEFMLRRTKREAESDCREWRDEIDRKYGEPKSGLCRKPKRSLHCHPVKVKIEVTEVPTGKEARHGV